MLCMLFLSLLVWVWGCIDYSLSRCLIRRIVSGSWFFLLIFCVYFWCCKSWSLCLWFFFVLVCVVWFGVVLLLLLYCVVLWCWCWWWWWWFECGDDVCDDVFEVCVMGVCVMNVCICGGCCCESCVGVEMMGCLFVWCGFLVGWSDGFARSRRGEEMDEIF